MKKIIVIIGGQRCGTTALQRAFSGTGQVEDFSEIFHTEEGEITRESNYFYWLNNVENIDKKSNQGLCRYDYMENLAIRYLNYLSDFTDKDYFLIDIKHEAWPALSPSWFSVFRMPLFMNVLDTLGSRFIHMRRRNIFAQYISILYARKIGKWHYDKNDISTNESKISITVNPYEANLFIDSVDKNVKLFDEFLSRCRNHTSLNYEATYSGGDLTKSARKKLMSILDKDLVSALNLTLRKTPYLISEVVENPEELLEFFYSSDFYYQIYASLKL
ncbi:hypothetical protein [Okeania sp. SIO1I7]|uniref:hypothetical protein n=1 Tax=Okeania sp. SIO1I7 TaxID=2607772 RepID=UPI0013F7E0D5|nr:hypothetical protein [Okeania sp. SIO1I7]NET27449.1 hypothetical protein [Okeania sp. SIO1I7]